MMGTEGKLNPKMQPRIKIDHRTWQPPVYGDYGWGECPLCGSAGEDQDSYSIGEDHISAEWFHCDDCDIDYAYQVMHFFRFSHIERD